MTAYFSSSQKNGQLGSGTGQIRMIQIFSPRIRIRKKYLFDQDAVFKVLIAFLKIRMCFLLLELGPNPYHIPNTDPDLESRVEDPHSFNPDPDPIRIQVFNDQKLKNITAENCLKFFLDRNLQFTYP